jgi:circadian clock protein KaiB
MSPQQKDQKPAADRGMELVLCLYIAAGAPNSVQAIDNIKRICHEYHRDSYRLEIIDVLEFPERAMDAGILVTPTLLKLSPAPASQVVGNLSDKQKVLLALGSKEKSHE